MNNKNTVFKYNKDFSRNILGKLRENIELYDTYICGSVMRCEALPMSDVDLVYFGKYNKKINNIKIDKIDRVDNLYLGSGVAKRLYDCMSPEAGFLDSKPLNGGTDHQYYDCFNSKENLLNKFIWEYNYRFLNERSNKNGYNLKYSIGAYRDILLINLFGRFLKEKNNYTEPEILDSIKKIKENIKFDYSKLLESIELIMLTKSTVLLAHAETISRGRTQLTIKTLKKTFLYDKEFGNITKNNPKKFLHKYLECKKCLENFLDEIYKYINKRYKNYIYNSIITSLDIINSKNIIPFEKILKQETSDNFPVQASIITNKKCPSTILEKIARKNYNDVGHFCTNRLIAKSPKTNNRTLIFMLANSKFALDDWTNKRYRTIIKKRLKYEK